LDETENELGVSGQQVDFASFSTFCPPKSTGCPIPGKKSPAELPQGPACEPSILARFDLKPPQRGGEPKLWERGFVFETNRRNRGPEMTGLNPHTNFNR
jgi:hypothetical protein